MACLGGGENQRVPGKKQGLFQLLGKRPLAGIPVDLSDVPLLGNCFEGRYYFDKYLSMGLRSAAFICQRVTNAICFMCQMLHIAIVKASISQSRSSNDRAASS